MHKPQQAAHRAESSGPACGRAVIARNRFQIALTLAVLGLLARTAAADIHYRIEAVTPRVHVQTQGDAFHLQPSGNVEIIEQDRGIVLVDSGGSSAAAEEVIAFVHSVSKKPVIAIVLTHWHGDHVLGVSRILREWPHARVISTRPTRDMLASTATDRYMPGSEVTANLKFLANVRDGTDYLRKMASKSSLTDAERLGFGQAAREYEQYGLEMASSRRVTPRETFDRSLRLPDGTVPIHVEFMGRANTEGDAIVWLPRQRVVITGDVVTAPIPFGFNTYPREWIGVLQKIRDLHFSILIPGHGLPRHNTEYIDGLIAALNDVRTQVAPLASSKLDAAAVSERINLDALRDRLVGDDPWLRRWFKSYWKDPIVSSALREARGEPIVQGSG